MKENEIKIMEEELKNSLEEFHKSLETEDHRLEIVLLEENKYTLSEIKDFIKILSGIIATIIPFSSLIFTISKEVLKPNIYLWGISLILFLISLFILLFSYFKYVNKLFERMVNNILNYDSLDMVGYFLNKDDDAKLTENLKSLTSHHRKQEKLRNSLVDGLFENKLVVMLLPKIKLSLFFLLSGFIFLFISIFYEKFYFLIKNIIICS